ncbi:MAG: fasciclin domain-containing protein [Chloroflexota bacterium]|jgi:uncharacterized surface protein with fasciclin (FAS1) repeats
MFKKIMAGVLLASLALTAFAPAAAGAEAKGQIKSNKDAVSRIVGFSSFNNDRLDTLIAAVTCEQFEGDVVELLANTDKITIFAPTNYAFRKLGRQLDQLLDLGLGKDGLTAENVCAVDSLLGEGTLFTILGYHVTTPKIWYKQAKAARGATIDMFTGEPAAITGQRDVVRIDGAKVVVKNIRSKNAITHVISDVMIPPSVEEALADAIAS